MIWSSLSEPGTWTDENNGSTVVWKKYPYQWNKQWLSGSIVVQYHYVFVLSLLPEYLLNGVNKVASIWKKKIKNALKCQQTIQNLSTNSKINEALRPHDVLWTNTNSDSTLEDHEQKSFYLFFSVELRSTRNTCGITKQRVRQNHKTVMYCTQNWIRFPSHTITTLHCSDTQDG